MRILTEVYGPAGMRKKKFRVEGNNIVVRKGKQGRGSPGYRPSFTKESIIPYRTGFPPFRRMKQKLMLIEGADSCMSIRFELDGADPKAIVNMPIWDRFAEEKLFDAATIKNAGAVTNKLQIPGMLYVLIIMVAVLSLVGILLQTGRLKL